MFHFVTINKKTGEIKGRLSTSTKDYVPKPISPDEENLEVTDTKHIELLDQINPMNARLRGAVHAGKISDLRPEPIFQGRIGLTTDREDRDGDGLPELPADGESIARIRATLYDLDGKSILADPTLIGFRTTRGLLSRRAADTVEGVVEIELRSVAETTAARVTASADGFESASLVVEFIPVEEFHAIQRPHKKRTHKSSET